MDERAESQPEGSQAGVAEGRTPGEPVPVRVRRAPRFAPFIATGAVVGVLVGILVSAATGSAATGSAATGSAAAYGEVGPGAVTGYLAMIGLLIGGVVGAGLAVLADRRR